LKTGIKPSTFYPKRFPPRQRPSTCRHLSNCLQILYNPPKHNTEYPATVKVEEAR
jgi:hypothetical protein